MNALAHLCLLLAGTASFSGRVLDPTGQPAAGATVRLGTVGTRSDAQGRYRLKVLAGVYTVTLSVDNLTIHGTLGCPLTVGLRFRLRRKS